MFFRLIKTWALFASISLCIAAYETSSSYNNNDNQAYSLGNLVSYEKFSEGDQVEPLLYGQYTITENVSPYIPLNPLTESFLNYYNYQSAGNNYKTNAKSMPANFDVYTAKNPSPAQATYAQSNDYNQGSIYRSNNGYSAPVASSTYNAPNNYGSNNYQASASVSTYTPNYLPNKPEISYGLNYESHNQVPIFVPTAHYPTSSSGLISHNYPPAPQSSTAYSSAAQSSTAYPQGRQGPIISNVSTHKKLESNNSHEKPKDSEIRPKAFLKEEEKHQHSKADSKKLQTTQIANKAPKTSFNKTNSDKPNEKKIDLSKTQHLAQNFKNHTKKFVGYTYIKRKTPINMPNPINNDKRRSPSLMYNSNLQTVNRNYNQPLAYRNVMFVSSGTQSANVNPYPPSTLNYNNNTNSDISKKRSQNPQQFNFDTRETSKHSTDRNMQSRNLDFGFSPRPNFNFNQKPFYPPPINEYAPPINEYAQTIYNENSYGEVILRGYSANTEDNNNKAIVRIIEELFNGCLFEVRVCNLKKDFLYAVYIHDFGQISSGCESIGGEFGASNTFFNPMLGVRSNPVGFIGAFKYPGENLNIQHFSKSLHFSEINGRSICIHEVSINQKNLPEAVESNMLNNFSMLMNPLSSPLVSSKRVACGVIGIANPYSFLRPQNPNCDIEVPVIEDDTPDNAKRRDIKEEEKKNENENEKKKSDLKSE